MRRFAAAAAGIAVLAAGSTSFAQTVYPIDRAEILAGTTFDFKVEFPGLADPAKVSILIKPARTTPRRLGNADKFHRARGRQGSIGFDPARCFAHAARRLQNPR